MLINVLRDREVGVFPRGGEYTTSRGFIIHTPHNASSADEDNSNLNLTGSGCVFDRAPLGPGCIRGSLVALLIEGLTVAGGILAWQLLHLFR